MWAVIRKSASGRVVVMGGFRSRWSAYDWMFEQFPDDQTGLFVEEVLP